MDTDFTIRGNRLSIDFKFGFFIKPNPMRRTFALTFVVVLAGISAMRADEGMWLLHKLQQMNEADMRSKGLRLTAKDIYDINQASLKDAIVRLNGGMCTGEVISSKGLVLTNHHCAYDAIQGFSSTENDYLTQGFFAKALDQEMHIEGFKISFLVRIDDYTARMLEGVTREMTEAQRQEKLAENQAALMKELNADGKKELEMKEFFYGNEFYLFEYKTYRDIRLVGAPPESVGKYGGDTDNWMWPRHTGDFAMLRIYANGDNEPADFSKENKPFVPRRHLKVATDGVQEGDFTMVMGYPGSTDRFLSSHGVRQALAAYNPSVVDVRDLKLKVMKSHMDADPAVRIQYAAKYAQTANYWKYYIGQSKGLKRLRIEEQKKELEDAFAAWVAASPERQEKYGEALGLIQSFYEATDATVKGDVYAREAGLVGADIVLFAVRFSRGAAGLFSEDPEKVKSAQASLTRLAENFFKDYDQATDRDLFVALMSKYRQDIPSHLHPSFFALVQDKHKGDFGRFADQMYAKSFLVDREKCLAFIQKPSKKALDADLAVLAGNSALERYLSSQASDAQEKFDRGYRLFVQGLREMQPNKAFAPDANSTMRLTYGLVDDYDAADAVHYDYFTTAQGILEKMDNSNPEFVVDARMEKMLLQKDFGRWADAQGELRVCFVHGTDITGGNSGSPVLNANGDLIGLAFDGNWEAMSGDIAFEPELQRTISVDIRYVMWVVDRYAGATNIIQEIDFVPGVGSPRAAQ
jgi:hypothetical protein